MKRFSLRTLILLVTAVALFLGISQFRRQQIFQRVEQFRTKGVRMTLPNEWRDVVWQRTPSSASIDVHLPSIGTVTIAGRQLNPEKEARAVLALLQQELGEFGVTEVLLLGRRDLNGRDVIFTFDSIDAVEGRQP